MRRLGWLLAVVVMGCGDDGSSAGGDDSSGSGTEMRLDVAAVMPGAECDPKANNPCPEGYKCAPVQSGPLQFEARCVPLPEDPLPPGTDCLLPTEDYIGDGTSDPCDENSVCVWLGGELDTGRCWTLCPGGDADCPVGERCVILEAATPTCAPACDPLGNDCPEGTGCYSLTPTWTFTCLPTFMNAGGHGTPCAAQTVCESGTACYFDAKVGAPGCETVTCCAEYCDVNGPNLCPYRDLGEECVAPSWGSPPPGFEGAGACAIPQ